MRKNRERKERREQGRKRKEKRRKKGEQGRKRKEQRRKKKEHGRKIKEQERKEIRRAGKGKRRAGKGRKRLPETRKRGKEETNKKKREVRKEKVEKGIMILFQNKDGLSFPFPKIIFSYQYVSCFFPKKQTFFPGYCLQRLFEIQSRAPSCCTSI